MATCTMTAEALGGSNLAGAAPHSGLLPVPPGHVPATDRNPEAILHGACHPESGRGFAASARPGGLGPQPQHPSQLCASENGLLSPGPTPSARRLPSSLHTAPRLPSSGGQAPSRQSPAWPFPWGASAPWLGAWWRGRPPLQLCLRPACPPACAPPPTPWGFGPGCFSRAAALGPRPSLCLTPLPFQRVLQSV